MAISQREQDHLFSEFAASLPSETTTLIPIETLTSVLESAGCKIEDEKLRKVIALALHKFVSDVMKDGAAQNEDQEVKPAQVKPVEGASSKSKAGESRNVVASLSTEMLVRALCENGVQIEKPAYLAGLK